MSGDPPSPLANYQGLRCPPWRRKSLPSHPAPGGLRFLSETASLQEAGRALAIGPHPSNSHPFLVCSSNYASGDGVLPANEDTTPVFPFIPTFDVPFENSAASFKKKRRRTGVARSEKL
jgi:hypothetical protein